MISNLITDVIIILLAGLVGGLICRRFNLPLMLGYLVMGVLISRAAFGWIDHQSHEIEHIAHVGVFLLLFTIGLEFSLNELNKLSRYLLIGGGLQMVLVAAPVAGLLLWLGRSPAEALLISTAVAFSSTVVVFRVLSELGQTGTPHGQRAIAVLLFQDAALVPLLLAVPMLTGDGAVTLVDVGLLIGKTVGLIAAVVLLRLVVGKWAVPYLASLRSPELVLLSTVVILAAVTYATHWLALPPALGAFAAGLILNGNRLSALVDALILPFRQTFSAIFFVSLGLLLQPGIIQNNFLSIMAMLLIVVVLKGGAATIALRLTSLNWKASFGMGLGLAHLGEFSLVLALEAMNKDVVNEADYQQLLCVALLSLILTPFLLRWGLKWIDPAPLEDWSEGLSHEITDHPRMALVIGAGLIGRQVTSQLETYGCDVCLIDLSPINLHPFAVQGFHTIAGDARDASVLKRAHLQKAELVVLVVPDDMTAISVLKTVRDLTPAVPVIVRCRYHSNKQPLLDAGANHVISEEYQAAQSILQLLSQLNAR